MATTPYIYPAVPQEGTQYDQEAPAQSQGQRVGAVPTKQSFDLDDLLGVSSTPVPTQVAAAATYPAAPTGIPAPPTHAPPPLINHDPFGFDHLSAAAVPVPAAAATPYTYDPAAAESDSALSPLPVAELLLPQESTASLPPAAAAASTIASPEVASVDECERLRRENEADMERLQMIQEYKRRLEEEEARAAQLRAEQEKWPCPACTFQSPTNVFQCQVCETPRPGYQMSPPEITPVALPPPATTNVAPPSPGNGIINWSCEVCTLENPLAAAACSACEAPRPSHVVVPALPVETMPIQQQPRLSPATALAEVETWTCQPCTFENRVTHTKCEMCDAPRPSAAGSRSTRGASGARSQALTSVPAPHDEIQWQDDKFAISCSNCSTNFGLMTRKHHCRRCGFIFCGNCSNFRAKVKPTDKEEVRMCINCYNHNAA